MTNQYRCFNVENAKGETVGYWRDENMARAQAERLGGEALELLPDENIACEDDPVALPTVAQLNQLTASQVSLLLLRCLATSDMTFFYDLFEKRSMADVARITDELLVIETVGNTHGLTADEQAEFRSLGKSIVE